MSRSSRRACVSCHLYDSAGDAEWWYAEQDVSGSRTVETGRNPNLGSELGCLQPSDAHGGQRSPPGWRPRVARLRKRPSRRPRNATSLLATHTGPAALTAESWVAVTAPPIEARPPNGRPRPLRL